MLATSLGDGDANSAILRCSALRPASQDVMAQSGMSWTSLVASGIPRCMKQFRMREAIQDARAS